MGRLADADAEALHGGSPRGAERIAACWADHRKVPQMVFKPDWTRDRNAAPFKRNDRLLEALPIGVVVFPGSGIAANLADKAKKLGIPTWRFDQPRPAEGGAA
jgi:YspA, cpYpsA-related SLOG family